MGEAAWRGGAGGRGWGQARCLGIAVGRANRTSASKQTNLRPALPLCAPGGTLEKLPLSSGMNTLSWQYSGFCIIPPWPKAREFLSIPKRNCFPGHNPWTFKGSHTTVPANYTDSVSWYEGMHYLQQRMHKISGAGGARRKQKAAVNSSPGSGFIPTIQTHAESLITGAILRAVVQSVPE